jgi:hypothetical protein
MWIPKNYPTFHVVVQRRAPQQSSEQPSSLIIIHPPSLPGKCSQHVRTETAARDRPNPEVLLADVLELSVTNSHYLHNHTSVFLEPAGSLGVVIRPTSPLF